MSLQNRPPEEPNKPASGAEAVLFQRWLANALSVEEFAALEDRLLSDRAFRERYLQYVDLENCLSEELGNRPAIAASPLPHRRKPLRWGLIAMVTAVCLATVVVLWPGKPRHRPEHSSVSTDTVPNAISTSSEPPRIEHATAPLQRLPDVAIVTALGEQEAGPTLRVGSRLKPGVLTVRRGELQLDFLDGARVHLRGPAEFHLVSSKAATLVQGTVGVRIPFSQDSFTLSTSEAAVIGSWAEFGARILPSGRTRVQLLSGSAEISLLGDDGSTLISQRLARQAAVDVDADDRRFISLAESTEEWPRVVELDQAQLTVTPDYVREVKQSQPYLYWRFEDAEVGRITDALGGPYTGEIIGDQAGKESIRIANGVAEFLPSRGYRSIASRQLIPKFNADDSTIELWVMPTAVHAGAIFSTVLPDEVPVPLHLNFIEVALNTHLVHKPGVVRFLHREPPGQAGGYNLFSQDICAPGVWTHIVATKTPSELRLFINGQLIRSVTGPGTGASDDMSYRMVLGQLGTLRSERQFHGLIDEVAIYRRALRPEEISRHYWSIRRDVPLASVRGFDENRSLALKDDR